MVMTTIDQKKYLKKEMENLKNNALPKYLRNIKT